MYNYYNTSDVIKRVKDKMKWLDKCKYFGMVVFGGITNIKTYEKKIYKRKLKILISKIKRNARHNTTK